MISLLIAAAGLQDSAPDAPPIVITGKALADPREQELRDVTVIGLDDIASTPSRRIDDVLKAVAGVDTFRRAGTRSAHPTTGGLTMRALGGNAASRALVVLDGVPQHDPFGGWVSFPAIQTDLIERIVVTRGGGSGRWGAGALAGTVELETLGARYADGIKGSVMGGSRQSLDARAQAGVSRQSAYVIGGIALERGDGFIPIVAEDRGAADIAAPYRQASARVRGATALTGTMEIRGGLSLFQDRRSRGLSDSENRTKGSGQSLRLVGRGATPFALTVYAQQRRFSSEFAATDSARDTSRLTLDQVKVPAKGYGARAEISPSAGPLSLRIGADWRFGEGRTNELYSYVDGDPTRFRRAGGDFAVSGLFAEMSRELGPVMVEAAGRIDHWRLGKGRVFEQLIGGATLRDDSFATRQGWQPTFRAGTSVALTGTLRLRAAAYSGWRLPTLNELYRPYRIGADAFAANAALDPERSTGAEAALAWTVDDQTNVRVTAFAARLADAVANVALGQGPGIFPGVGFVSAGGTYFRRTNVDAIRSRGIEVDLDTRRGTFDAKASLALTRARVEADGEAGALDGKPPAQTPALSATAQLGWTGPANQRASLSLRYVSRQFEDDLGSEALRPALTLGGRLSWPVGRRLSLEAALENMFDARVETGIGSDGAIERAEPRTFWIGLALR